MTLLIILLILGPAIPALFIGMLIGQRSEHKLWMDNLYPNEIDISHPNTCFYCGELSSHFCDDKESCDYCCTMLSEISDNCNKQTYNWVIKSLNTRLIIDNSCKCGHTCSDCPNNKPRCIGYPDCDGDLEGIDHSEKCPLYKQSNENDNE